MAAWGVGVVIVSYNSEAEIRELLSSMVEESPEVALDIVVVSNSGDCESLGPGVRVVQSGGNIGFARACNLGAKQLQTEYVLFCNPDVRLSRKLIATLAQLLSDNKPYGIVAPYYGPGEHFCRPTGKLNEHPGINIGACFMMRRSEFERLGGFDEGFFLWWEDTDLRERVLRNGQKVGMADGVVAQHTGGHSYETVDSGKRRFLTRAWISSHAYYLLKHRGLAVTVLWLMGMCGRNSLHFVRRADTGRKYVLPIESVRFGCRLLAGTPGLLKLVTFDGERYGWQGP